MSGIYLLWVTWIFFSMDHPPVSDFKKEMRNLLVETLKVASSSWSLEEFLIFFLELLVDCAVCYNYNFSHHAIYANLEIKYKHCIEWFNSWFFNMLTVFLCNFKGAYFTSFWHLHFCELRHFLLHTSCQLVQGVTFKVVVSNVCIPISLKLLSAECILSQVLGLEFVHLDCNLLVHS